MLACAHTNDLVIAKCTSCGALLCDRCSSRSENRYVCQACLPRPRVVGAPPRCVRLTVLPGATIAAPPSCAAEPWQPRPALAGALGIVPGLGHLYAGSWLRGLAILFVLAPIATALAATGAISPVAYVFFHGLVAFDGYRKARKRRGEWSREDAREARGVWLSSALVLAGLSVAREMGAPIDPSLAWPAFLVPLGVGIALSGRRCDRPALDVSPAPAPPPAPEEPKEPAPGNTIDRRADRAALAAQLGA